MLGNPVHVDARSMPADPELDACYERVVSELKLPGGYPHDEVSISLVQEPEFRVVPARIEGPAVADRHDY
jgi:hypothetical protein